jgi:hypothetical protein
LDFLIISEKDDELALALLEVATNAGLSVQLRSYSEAAIGITLTVVGKVCEVVPDVPTFFRLPRALPAVFDSDQRFHHNERLAALWASLSLSRSTVINRPDCYGLLSRCSNFTTITNRRVGVEINTEILCSSDPVSAVGRTRQNWWIEDLKTGHLKALPDLPNGVGPYRCCGAWSQSKYSLVVVIGEQTSIVRPGDECPYHVREASKTLVSGIGLTFGVIGWEIASDGRRARVIAVNPHPALSELSQVWCSVAPAVISCLLNR